MCKVHNVGLRYIKYMYKLLYRTCPSSTWDTGCRTLWDRSRRDISGRPGCTNWKKSAFNYNLTLSELFITPDTVPHRVLNKVLPGLRPKYFVQWLRAGRLLMGGLCRSTDQQINVLPVDQTLSKLQVPVPYMVQNGLFNCQVFKLNYRNFHAVLRIRDLFPGFNCFLLQDPGLTGSRIRIRIKEFKYS